VLYHGLEVLGGGSILTGLILGAVGVFVIEKKFAEASAFALSGAVLTFFGFMHGESVGFAVTPTVAIAYAIVALFLFLLWVYYTAYLFLLGGEVAEMYDLVRMRRSQRVQLG